MEILPRISENCITKNEFCLPIKKILGNSHYLLLNTIIIPLYNGKISLIFL